MDEAARIRFVTRNFGGLQGLKMVPFGLFFLIMGEGWLGEQGDCTLMLPALLLTIFAYVLIHRYYARTYGVVKPANTNSVKNILITFAVLALLWAAAALDYWVHLPVNVFGLTLAAIMFGWWWLQERRIRAYYAFMAGLIALISLLPLGGVGQGWSIIQPPGQLFNLLLGSIYVLGGIFDHLTLLASLNHSRGDHERAV